MSVSVTCPSCGTESFFDELTRDAEAFCRSCDYPLFWTQASRSSSGDDMTQAYGLRRLPGAGGREAIATIACPQCSEPNALARRICIRCGADLRPPPRLPEPILEPEPEPIPEPEPEPIPEPESRLIWPLVVGLSSSAILVLIILILLAH